MHSLFNNSHNLEYKVIKKSKYFNKKWYLKTYSDVKESKFDPIEHYLNIGWTKGYNPSLKFDGNAYLESNLDVKQAGMNPLFHYEYYGKKEKRSITNLYKNKMTEFGKCYRFIKRHIAKLLYCKTIKSNQNKKILVVLHLFYPESWDIIKYYLKNLDSYNYDLIVTTIKNHHDEQLLKRIKKFHKNTIFVSYENKGFDIGPFLDVIHKTDISKYDIVFKLHSKGIKRECIFIYNQIFKKADWFFNLYNGILGEFSVHKVIKTFSENSKCGLVASKNLIVLDPKHKQFFTHQIAKKYNLKIKQKYKYVAGSCFVVKAKCLNKIKKIGLTIDDFELSARGSFSLAHAMERIICALVEFQGYNFYGILTKHPTYTKETRKAQETSAIRLLDDTRFILNYDFFYSSLEGRKIIDYQIKEIALKDINREWEGKLFKLNEVSPFMYLNGNKKRYQKYCVENKKKFNIEMSVNRYEKLISSIKKNGFKTKNMPVISTYNNIIMDGQHRSCYLMKLFGPDYKVKALFLQVE